jgi:predicted CXXCH cytochrome family protein
VTSFDARRVLLRRGAAPVSTRFFLFVVAVALAASAVAACGGGLRDHGAATFRPTGARAPKSNVEAADYAGSDACAACHAELVRTFVASPMHRMTRMAANAEISAPFQGESLTVGHDHARLEMHAGGRFVRVTSDLASADTPERLYRVTRVIGGHHREDFVGALVATYEEAPKLGDEELVLPVSYLIDKKRLRYKGYSVMVRERPRMEAGPVWDRTCPFCHNTVPLLSTLFGALAGPRAPHYQGEVVDALLPEDRAFEYRATDEAALEDAVSREMTRLGAPRVAGPLPAALNRAIDTTRRHFTGKNLLEVGIGCESCHGGCREHVVDPSVHPSLLPRAPYLSVRERGSEPRVAAEVETHACARCHQVLFSRYPWTWEGGRRHAMPGGSHINSGEARDLLLGGCNGTLGCTACHDPHAADDRAHLASLETTSGNEVCVACHRALGSKDALRAHAHHDPEGAAGVCIACHMPKKNMSLEGRLTRYHRVGSPTEPMRVLSDRPIECALCHTDKSVEALVATMETWWNKHYDRDILRTSYGDLGGNALLATLRRGKPHEKAVALAVLGAKHDREAAPLFAAELGDDYPLVRDYAASALRATFGDACDLNLGADSATVHAEMLRCSQAAGFPVGAPTTSAPTPPAGADEPVED